MSETGQKVAIVTGGSQGIGAGVVDGYRQRGWAVVAKAGSIPAEQWGRRSSWCLLLESGLRLDRGLARSGAPGANDVRSRAVGRDIRAKAT